MNIRVGKVKDVRPIATLMQQFPSKHVVVDVEATTRYYESLVASGKAVLLILESDSGEMVGGLGFTIQPDLHSGIPFASETYWFVLPQYREQGNGLLERYEEEARSKGCNRVVIMHMMDSMPDVLERVYERHGYTLTEKVYSKELL